MYSVYCRGLQIFQKFGNNLKSLGTRMVIRSKFRTEDPQILSATVRNLVARVTWRPWFCAPDLIEMPLIKNEPKKIWNKTDLA
jgi:hypothetical protein